MAYPVVGRASVEWYLSAEHGEDQLPIPVRRAFVMDVAVGQRIAMLRARVEFVLIRDRAAAQKVAEFLDHCRRRMGIVFRQAAINSPPKPLREPMRGIVAIGNQRRSVQAGTGDEPIRVRTGDTQDISTAHAIADRADATWTDRPAPR